MELREIAATAAISAGSNILHLPAAAGFVVGDYIIVEIGKGPDQGVRGTRDVGGTWPKKSYSTFSELEADRAQPEKLFAYAENTGQNYQWSPSHQPGEWVPIGQGYLGWYYARLALPRSLQARVLAISTDGKALTLDRHAAVAVAGANVYLDVIQTINAQTAWRVGDPASQEGVIVQVPAGEFAMGGLLGIGKKVVWTLAGDGKNHTRFFTPKGVPSARLDVRFSPETTLKDFTWQGNFGDNGYGLNWASPGYQIPPGISDAGYLTETDYPHGDAQGKGIFCFGSPDSVVQDIRVIDVFMMACQAQNASNVWARRIESITNTPFREYISWMFAWADTVGGGCVDCSVSSPYVVAGFEAFRSRDVSFIRPTGTNALLAMNSAGNFLVEGARLTFKPLTLPATTNIGNPIININSNINDPQFLALGGTIRDAQMVQEGYIDGQGNSLQGIMTGPDNANVRVEGGYYQAPDWKDGSQMKGAVGLRSHGQNVVVDGFNVYGRARPDYANIFVDSGVVRNSQGFVIWAPQVENNGEPVGDPASGPLPLPPPPTPPPVLPPDLDTSLPGDVRGTSVTFEGALWTLGRGLQTLRDGVHEGGGSGHRYVVRTGVLYVRGTDINWYRWQGNWVWDSSARLGPEEPPVVVIPPVVIPPVVTPPVVIPPEPVSKATVQLHDGKALDLEYRKSTQGIEILLKVK